MPEVLHSGVIRNVVLAGVAVLFLWVFSVSYTSSVLGGRLDPKRFFPLEEQTCAMPEDCALGIDLCRGGEWFPLRVQNFDRYMNIKHQMCMNEEGRDLRPVAMRLPREWPKADCGSGYCVVKYQPSAQ